jgi:undecaprenyl-diphosphatase
MSLRARLTASPLISKRLVVIYLLLILGITLFLFVYDGVKESADLASLDVPIKMWAQTHQYAPLTATMRVVTDILSPTAVGAFTLIGAVLWAWRKKEYWRPVVTVGAVSFAFIIAAIIKDYTARARPTVTDLLGAHAGISYSFPSGHTIGVATLLFTLSYFVIMSHPTLRRASLWFALSAISIILVAFSRIYLGYHWLTDVTASVGLAIIVLALVVSVDTYVRRHRARLLQKRL